VLQLEDPELSQVFKKLKRKEHVPEFSLFNGVLHYRSRYDYKMKFVVLAGMVLILFSYYLTFAF
jgi:hypothetical protein